MLRTPRPPGDASLIDPAPSEPPAPIAAPAAATDPAESDPSLQRRAIASVEARMAAAATHLTATANQLLDEMNHLVAEAQRAVGEAGLLRADVSQTEGRIAALVERLEPLLKAAPAETESRGTEPSPPSPPTSEAEPRTRTTSNSPRPDNPLTAREREVLELVASGLPDVAIAYDLGCHVRTVNKHMETIRLKLGVDSRSAAVAVAVRRGWIA